MKNSFYNPDFHEKELVSKYGKDLSAMQLGDSFDVINKDLISFFKAHGWWNSRKMRGILSSENFRDCSMKIDSYDELDEHAKRLSEFLYLHYGLAKENRLEGQFPDFSCGRSSRNGCFSLMDFGYFNACCLTYIDSSFGFNHTVVGLPFSKGGENGFLIGDPTSDQFLSKRNLIGVLDSDASYVTFDGKNKINPQLYLSANTVKEYFPSINAASKNIGGYLKNIFSNPVNLDV